MVSQFQKIHYSEPNSASDYQFSDPSLGFFGSGVPAKKNNGFKGLFLQNNRFTCDSILQFNGVLRAPGFDTYFRLIFERNGLQMPLGPLYRDHVGEIGVL